MLDREDYDLITRFDSNPAERLNMLNNPNERIQVSVFNHPLPSKYHLKTQKVH
jgi:hypothetical protein